MAKTKLEIQKEYEKRTNYAAQKKYNKTNIKSYSFRFMINTENGLIEWLEKQPNKSGYMKELIRKDMEKHKDQSEKPE